MTQRFGAKSSTSHYADKCLLMKFTVEVSVFMGLSVWCHPGIQRQKSPADSSLFTLVKSSGSDSW